MATVVLFHSVLGLRPGVVEAAERLRRAGHAVHTPDLYLDGTVFDDYEEAAAHAETIGYSELVTRARAAAETLPADLVYAGFSNGGPPALLLGASRPGARGVILLHAAIHLARLGIDAWPASVPVQVHYSKDDPFRRQESIDSLAASVRESGARYEFFEYPGAGHLFADPGRAREYDPDAAALMWDRVLAFLAETT